MKALSGETTRKWEKELRSGNGNSVLTEGAVFEIGIPWLGNLGFISQGPCTLSSQEGTGDRVSFWMKKTCSGSWSIF
jgi:hypothetical protein